MEELPKYVLFPCKFHTQNRYSILRTFLFFKKKNCDPKEKWPTVFRGRRSPLEGLLSRKASKSIPQRRNNSYKKSSRSYRYSWEGNLVRDPKDKNVWGIAEGKSPLSRKHSTLDSLNLYSQFSWSEPQTPKRETRYLSSGKLGSK